MDEGERIGTRKVFPGQRHGCWTVIEGTKKREYDGCLLHLCRCDCGVELYKPGSSLLQGRALMCAKCNAKKPMRKGMKTLIDLTGQVFGGYTVLHRTDPPRANATSAFYLCQCRCGVTRVLSKSALSKNKHGCTKCKGKNRAGSKSYGWTGYEEMHGKFLYRNRHGAKQRGLEYSVSNEYIWNLFIAQNRKCALSGVDIHFGVPSEAGKNTASLDRIDSNLGYIEGNLQWIHYKLNPMKMAMSQDEFIRWAKLIADFN